MTKRVKIITSIVCLLPLIMSAAVYKQVPKQMPIHWDSMGQPNTYIHRAAGAFGIPVLMLIIHLCTMLGLSRDVKKSNHSAAVKILGSWAVPIACVFFVPIMLLAAMGYSVQISTIVTSAVGLLVLICGNYLPKSRINHAVGFRLPWTMEDDNNWYRTHRVAGFLWMLCGIALIVYGFFKTDTRLTAVVVLLLVILLAAFPIGFSYALYRRKHGN